MGFKSLLAHKASRHMQTPVSAHPNSTNPLPILQPKAGKRGCEHCPLNHVPGIRKVFGKVRGRKIFIWAQSPGMQENKERKELIGPSGKFWWKELKRVGISRDDCDIQNVVRCVPADRVEGTWPPLKMRAPNKEEVKCCSYYNEKAVLKSKARLHLVLGQIAAKSLLGKEYRKDKRIFYSDALHAWVVCLDHPSYFIRQGYSANKELPPNEALKRFRESLKRGKSLLGQKKHDRFHYINSLNCIGITTRKAAREAYRKLKRQAIEKGIRLTFDMEEGDIDGKRAALCCGIMGEGASYTFALGAKKDIKISDACRKLNLKLVCKLLHNPDIKKSAQYGASDVDAVARLLGCKVEGYEYDTEIAEFFRDPDSKAYGLLILAERRFPEFAGYKDVVFPHAFSKEFKKKIAKMKTQPSLSVLAAQARKKGDYNLGEVPWNILVRYNGADCHLEKRIEISNRKRENPALMRVYTDSSHILYKMQHDRKCHPIFDYAWNDELEVLYTAKEKSLHHQVKKLCGKYIYMPKKTELHSRVYRLSESHHPERLIKKWRHEDILSKKRFNPDSGDQILWLLFGMLGLPITGEADREGYVKPNTQAGNMIILSGEHKEAALVTDYRKIKKIQSTYRRAYQACADVNDGHLRTNWKQTGTGTGRLSSGASKDRTNEGVINFQNIHGDPLLQCLLVSDHKWRDLYGYWLSRAHVERTGYDKDKNPIYTAAPVFVEDTWREFEEMYVYLGFDFSQMELRVLAEMSGDKNLLALFAKGTDIHVEVGHALTGWSRELIASDQRIRRMVKNMHFGMIYGLSGKGLYRYVLAKGAQATEEEIEKYHRRYFERFPGVRRLIDRLRAFAEKHGYVESMFGFQRKLKVDEQKEEGNDYVGAYWGNQAINSPVQGSAHQLMLMSVAALYRRAIHYYLLNHPQLEIHDALYFRLRLKKLWAAMKQGQELMVNEPPKIVREDFKLDWHVPLMAEPKAGFRFGVQVEGLGEKDLEDENAFLNSWCLANWELEHSFHKQVKLLTAH